MVFLVALVLVAGCATRSFSVGRDFDASKSSGIIKGKTTAAEIREMFGEPFTKTVISEAGEKWIYTYTSGSATAQATPFSIQTNSTGSTKTLDILFNNGIVANFTYNESELPSKIY
jgi:hypothetical protein